MLEDKVKKVIRSCTTQEQLDTAHTFMILATKIQPISLITGCDLKEQFNIMFRLKDNELYNNTK